jgi:hypothetical protein
MRTSLFYSILQRRAQIDYEVVSAKSADLISRYCDKPFTKRRHLLSLTVTSFVFFFKEGSLTQILCVFGRFEFVAFFHPISPFPRKNYNSFLIYFFARFFIVDKPDRWFLGPLECFVTLLGQIVYLCS